MIYKVVLVSGVQQSDSVIHTYVCIYKTLMLGKIEGKRRRGQQTMRWLDSIADSMDMNLSKLWEIVKDRKASCCSQWGHKESNMT